MHHSESLLLIETRLRKDTGCQKHFDITMTIKKDGTVARKHLLQTTAFFFLAYALAPWVSNVVINHFNDAETSTLQASTVNLDTIPLTQTP